jgi:hypothetical protein
MNRIGWLFVGKVFLGAPKKAATYHRVRRSRISTDHSRGYKMTRAIIAGVILVLLQGCSIFTQPKANPVIEDRVNNWLGAKKVGVLATTPERRVVIVKMPENMFCAEPPADAADNVSAALTAIAEGSAKGQVTDVQLGYAQTLATSVKQLFQRSQGVQLYRDGTFMLCNAYLNGAINPEEFLKRHEKLLETVAPLIMEEIPELHKQKAVDSTVLPVTPEAPDVKSQLKQSDGKSEETGKGEKTHGEEIEEEIGVGPS